MPLLVFVHLRVYGEVGPRTLVLVDGPESEKPGPLLGGAGPRKSPVGNRRAGVTSTMVASMRTWRRALPFPPG